MEQTLKKTLQDLLDCAYSWEPDVRILGNVRAGDMRQALHRALAAVAFVEANAYHHADAVEIAGHPHLAESLRAFADEVLKEGTWAERVGDVPPHS